MDHIGQVQHVLRLLYKAGVTLDLKKYQLFAETIDYLSLVIRRGRLEHARYTTDAVTKLERPTTQT